MQYRKLGQSDITSPVIGLGAWAIGGDSQWGHSDDDVSVRTIHEAIDRGITLIDTAPAYGLGHSEEVVGRAIADRRGQVILSTKCGLMWDKEERNYKLIMKRDGVNVYRDLSPDGIIEQVENSLRRLGTDYIDILITHWQSEEPNFTPVDVSMETIGRLLDAGKIRAVGIANVEPHHIDEYAACGRIALVQQKYSMLDRRAESDGTMDACERHGITYQAYSPLERGLLTGKVTMDTQISGSAKERTAYFRPEIRSHVIHMLDQFRPLCEKYNTSMSSLVIAWTAARKPFLNVLCGGRKPEQVADNAAGGSVILDAEDMAFMDRLSLAAGAGVVTSV